MSHNFKTTYKRHSTLGQAKAAATQLGDVTIYEWVGIIGEDGHWQELS
jgi:hypothetical protein